MSTPNHIRPLGLMAATLATLAFLIGPVPAAEQGDSIRGAQIAAEAERRDEGFVDSIADLEMVLEDAAGNQARRALTIKTFERGSEEEGHKSLVVFHEPLDIKGTALLTHAEIFDADQQWLYLPAIKRVKRISSSNKTGPFVGSEFSFEDMLPPELERYDHLYIENVRCAEAVCHKLKRIPRDEDSGYSYQIAYLDTDHLRLQRVDYFDRKGTRIKTLFFSQYEQFGRFWRARRMSMLNHITGKSTHLLWGPFTFQNGFSRSDFSRTAMNN